MMTLSRNDLENHKLVQICVKIRYSYSELAKIPVWLSLDKGGSMTKILIVDKDELASDDVKKNNIIKFTCLTFLNENAYEGLELIKDRAVVLNPNYTGNAEKVIYGSGLGTFGLSNKCESLFGLKTSYCEEIISVGKGLFHLIKNSYAEDFIAPKVTEMGPNENYNRNSDWMNLIVNETRKRLANNGKIRGIDVSSRDETTKQEFKFPAVIAFYGTASGIIKLDKDGKVEIFQAQAIGGRTFLALAQLLLDTVDYQEIMDLAATGDRRKTDSQTWEVLGVDKDCPYGQFNMDIPIFFGAKSILYDKQKKDFSREDLAACLVGMITESLLSNITNLCVAEGIETAYITGNLMNRSDVFQREILRSGLVNFPMEAIDWNLVKTGHLSTIGALFSSASV